MMPVQIGYAQAVITPSLARPIFLAGFGRNRRAASVHDDLYARALALAQNGRYLIVVALDLIGLHRAQCAAIAQRVAAQIPGAQMLIACTHTHHGPDTLGLWGPDEQTSGVDAAYLDFLFDTVVQTAAAAAADGQEVHLASAAVVVPGVAKNFRDPAITDEELTCLQFRAVAGERPLATWLIFPCHPEVLWDENPHITADYIFTLRQQVEAATGAPCLVHVGALGGMMSPDVVEHSFAEAAAMGETLARAAFTTLGASPSQPVNGWRFDRHRFDLPLENPLFEMAAAIGLLPDVKQPDGTILTEASLLRLNDVWLFAVPGELLPKLGLQYRALLKKAGARVTAVIGLANDELGYILPAEDFAPPQNYLEPGSSYEESMSVGPQTGPRLTMALHALLDHGVDK
jgi:hypothetical protein